MARLSQAELSELSGVDQGTISELESGKTRAPQSRTVDKLICALEKRLPSAVVTPPRDDENEVLRHRMIELEIELGRAQLRIRELVLQLDAMRYSQSSGADLDVMDADQVLPVLPDKHDEPVRRPRKKRAKR